MKFKDFTGEQIEILSKKVGRNSEHLRKIALGNRPCPPNLAEAIEKATGGLIKKEDLVWPE